MSPGAWPGKVESTAAIVEYSEVALSSRMSELYVEYMRGWDTMVLSWSAKQSGLYTTVDALTDKL